MLTGLAVGIIVAILYFRPAAPSGALAPPVEVARPAEAPDASPTSPVAAAGPALAEVTFDDGFCSQQGGEAFEAHFTLQRLLNAELRRRLGSDAGDPGETAVLLEAAKSRDWEVVLAHATQAAARVPDSPFAQVVVALAAQALDQPDERLGALRRARQRLPSDPAIGLALAEATRDSADLDEAIDGLSTYLAVHPVAGVSRLRARLEVQRDIQRTYRREAHDGITVLWPAEVIADREADELAGFVDRGLDDAAAFTGTRRRQRLTVVVYPSRSELLAVSCARTWTAALFDGVLRVVASPGQGVDRKVVRHETLHAQLSPQAPQAPKWFHEGVAQSFAQQAFPRNTWTLMVRNHVWVPFSSLEGSFQVFASSSDADLAYAQSYAMVELMRELGGDRSVSIALLAFQSGADTPTAMARACGRFEVTGADLLQFLERRLAKSRGQ